MNKAKLLQSLIQVVSENKIDELMDTQAASIAKYLASTIEQLVWLNNEPCASMFKIEHPTATEQREAKNEGNDDVNKFVDEMYEIYPTRCPKRNASLGKSRKDKDRIKKLLKTYSKEQIEQVIRNEVDSNYGVNYMKNFSTFLNNFPEPNDSATNILSTAHGKAADVLVINGQVYK